MLRAEYTEGGDDPENPNRAYVLTRGTYDSYGVVAAFQSKEQADAWAKTLAPELDELECYVEQLPMIKPGVMPTIYTLYVASYQGKVEEYRVFSQLKTRAQRTIRELDVMGLDEIVPARIRMEHNYKLWPSNPLQGSVLITADGVDKEAVIKLLHERLIALREEKERDGAGGETPDPAQPA